MKFLRQLRRTKKQRPTSFSLVDIGRDTVKAVVLLVIPGNTEPQVIGYGIAETGGHDIMGGRLEADLVTGPVNIALTQAEDSTEGFIGQKIVPDDVIFAMSGQATTGKLFTVQQTRPKPASPISAQTLNNLRNRAERLVQQGLPKLSVEGGQCQSLAVTDAGLYLDDNLVLGGIGLTGQHLFFSVFGVAAQTGALRALELLANRLDLIIANIVASSQALAAAIPHQEAIILDTGLTGTDLCLIRDNALVAIDWIPFGGSFFTQTLAQARNIKPEAAEKLKHAFSNGLLSPAETELIKAQLYNAYQRWQRAVVASLKQLNIRTDSEGKSHHKPLPRKIFLVGGGNLLPDLAKTLSSNPTPFDRVPEVTRFGPHLLPAMKDLTEGLDYNLFSLSLSLMVGLPD